MDKFLTIIVIIAMLLAAWGISQAPVSYRIKFKKRE